MNRLIRVLIALVAVAGGGVTIFTPPARAADAGVYTMLAPLNALVGRPVGLSGTRSYGQGWSPGEPITIWLAGSNGQKDWTVPADAGSAVAMAVADANGNWGASFIMPDRRTGLHEVYVRGSINFALFTARGQQPVAGTYLNIAFAGFLPAGAEYPASGVYVYRTRFPFKDSPAPNTRYDTAINAINVLPYLDLSAGSAPPGTGVTLRGTGFGSLESGITVNFTGAGGMVNRVVASGITADPNGAWTATFRIPDGPAGRYNVDINSGSAAVYAGAVLPYSTYPHPQILKTGTVVTTQALLGMGTFSVARGLRLVPDRAGPGATVYMLGRGLAATSAVTVRLDGAVMTTSPAAVTTDASGLFLASFTVPAAGVSYGAHEATATDAGGGMAAAQLTVARAAVIQLTPKYGIPGDTVAVTGSGFNGGVAVDLAFNDAGLRTSPGFVTNGADGSFAASFVVPEQQEPGYHSVAARDSSNETASASFTVQDWPASFLGLPVQHIPAFGQTQGADGVAYLDIKVSRIRNPGTDADMPAPGGIGGYEFSLSYPPTTGGNGINIMAVRGPAPFAAPVYGTLPATSGILRVSASQTGAAPQAPLTLAQVAPRILGSSSVSHSLVLSFNSLLDGAWGNNIPSDGTKTFTLRRGNARNDGAVDMSDALFIAQFRVGIRGAGEDTSLTHIINGASVKLETATTGEKLDMSDALFIAQFRVQLRDASFNWLQ
ncbi:MAG: hypothetical protein HY673_14430 [Chloroflexi bacterium]|nr:hypothetical protein [Chloroflexota bacterium]